MKAPKFNHPVLATFLVIGGIYWTANACQERAAENRETLAGLIDERGHAVLGGAALNLEGLETDLIKRPVKPYKNPPRLGETDVLTARNKLLEKQGKSKDDLVALALSSCVLAAANAPDKENVAATMSLASRQFEGGKQELAAVNCTDYVVGLLSKNQDNLITITGVTATNM